MSALLEMRCFSGMSLTADLVARCHRDVPRPSGTAGQAVFGAADYDRAAQDVLSALGDGPIWVFAYGSLMWNQRCPRRSRGCAPPTAGTGRSASR